MNLTKPSWLIPLLLCGSLFAADSTAPAKKRTHTARPAEAPVDASPPAPPIPPDIQTAARIVHYGEKDIVPLKTKVLNTTLIVLPHNEKILDFVTGDKEYWVINGSENFAYVKPAKPSAQTNLNLITASGNIYSFVLKEVSEQPDATPDLKVFVEPKEQSLIGSANAAPRFVAARDVEDLQHRLEESRDEVRKQKRATEQAVENAVNKFLGRVRFTYHFDANRKPFSVQAMFHDDKFTYIVARPSETPTLYEMRDSQPNLINFEYQNGVYVVQKLLDKGYLVVGKHKLEFKNEE